MRPKKVLRYYCGHCPKPKGYWKKQECLEHEKRCYFNQDNKKCGSCFHFLKGGYFCGLKDKQLGKHWEPEELEAGWCMIFPKHCADWKINKIGGIDEKNTEVSCKEVRRGLVSAC